MTAGAFGDRADVHPATLRRVGAGDPTPVVRPPRRPTPARSHPTPIWTVRVHPEVWSLALTLAGGDVRRLVVASPTEVYVDLPVELADRIRAERTRPGDADADTARPRPARRRRRPGR